MFDSSYGVFLLICWRITGGLHAPDCSTPTNWQNVSFYSGPMKSFIFTWSYTKRNIITHARLGATILLYKWKLLCSHDKCPGQKTALCCGQLWETFTKHCLWSSEKLANSGLMILTTVIFDTYKCLGVWVNDKLFIMCTLLIFPGSSERRFLFDESKLLYSFF